MDNDITPLEKVIVTAIASPFIITGSIILWFIGAFMKGFVLTKMWVWFVIPLYPEAPVLSLWQAVGLGMIIAFVVGKTTVYKNQEVNIGASIISTLTYPCLCLLCAWIVYLMI